MSITRTCSHRQAAVLLAVAFTFVAARASAEDAPAIVPGAPNLALPPPPPDAIPEASPPPQAAAPSGGGDAEPAPGEPAPRPPGAPVVADTLPHGGRHRLAVGARFAYRLGDAGQAISPAAGYGIVGSYDFTYARVGNRLELAAGVDFSSDRFATGEQGTTTDDTGPGNIPMTVTYSSTRVLSENNFIVAQTFALDAGSIRPFVMLGAGLGIGSFESVDPRYKPADKASGGETDTHLIGRAALGFDIPVGPAWSVRVRGDYTAVRRAAPFTTTAGVSVPLFGDLLDIDVAAGYRF